MNRRNLVLSAVCAFPLLSSAKKLLGQDSGVVSILEHIPFTKYVDRWHFSTEKEAIAFVRSLYPVVTESHMVGGVVVWIRCEICNDQTMEFIKLSDIPLLSIEQAWGVLSNIRVNGKPVDRPMTKMSSLSEYSAMVFRSSDAIKIFSYANLNDVPVV